MCFFAVANIKIYLDPNFPDLAPFGGPFLKFSPKHRFTIGMHPLEHLLIIVIVGHKSGIMNRQIGIKNFIRVVILGTSTRCRVIQRMRNPKTAMARYVQPKGDILQVSLSLKL